MRMNRASRYVVLFLFLPCLFLAITKILAQPAPQNPAAASVPPAEQQFKNIQVLKGVPADQLIPAMQFISASLGVECEYCHVKDAFDKDDKDTKTTARKMMQM